MIKPNGAKKPVAGKSKPAVAKVGSATKTPAVAATAVKPDVKADAKPATKPITKTASKSVQPTVAKSKATTAEVVVPKKPAAAKPAKSAKPALKAKPAIEPKLKKPKLVRDSFTMPEAEYQILGDMKKAALKAGFEIKKSELLRVGVALIQKLDIAKLKEILAALPPLKAGRPKNDK